MVTGLKILTFLLYYLQVFFLFLLIYFQLRWVSIARMGFLWLQQAGPLLPVVRQLLTLWPLVAVLGVSSCGSWAQLPHCTWNLHRDRTHVRHIGCWILIHCRHQRSLPQLLILYFEHLLSLETTLNLHSQLYFGLFFLLASLNIGLIQGLTFYGDNTLFF